MAAHDKARYDKQLLEFAHEPDTSQEHVFDFRKPRRSFDVSDSHSHSKSDFQNSDLKSDCKRFKESGTKDTTMHQQSHAEQMTHNYDDDKLSIIPQ